VSAEREGAGSIARLLYRVISLLAVRTEQEAQENGMDDSPVALSGSAPSRASIIRISRADDRTSPA
jgi:hypothetical protein